MCCEKPLQCGPQRVAGWAVPPEGLLVFLKILSPYRQSLRVLEWLQNMEVRAPADRQGTRCPTRSRSRPLELDGFQALYPPRSLSLARPSLSPIPSVCSQSGNIVSARLLPHALGTSSLQWWHHPWGARSCDLWPHSRSTTNICKGDTDLPRSLVYF